MTLFENLPPKVIRFNLGARLTLSIGASIILVSVALFVWLYQLQEKQAMEQVEVQASALLTEMMIVRDWVAEYGDVWTTQPGELYVEGRDGFYRKSPGMVTKEISLLTNSRENFQFHITSLDLKNPENAPDSFELHALMQFETMPATVSQIEEINGQRYYRQMIPLITQATCMECHAGAQIGEIRGGISVLVPMAEVDKSLATSRQALVTTATVIVLFMMALLYWLVRRMVILPLNQLRGAAQAMGEGNYQSVCILQTGDELQTLGETFNHMSGNLKAYQESLQNQIQERTRELHALSEMALTISRSHDLKTVLNEALAQALQATQMNGGIIHLVGSNGKHAITIQKGVPTEIVSCMALAVSGEGCALWDMHQSVREVNLDLNTEHLTCLRTGCPAIQDGYRSLIIVPLRSSNRAFGTFTLMQKAELALSPEKKEFITCLGNQLGVAVENSHFQVEIERLAILEERSRIARDLHDSLAQTLGWLNLKMDMLMQTLDAGNIPQTREEAYRLQQVVGQACFEVRESIDGLRAKPTILFSEAVTSYITEFSQRTGLHVNLTVDTECRLTPPAEIEALRILQEALTNIYKHARASSVDVIIANRNDQVEISIQDNGQGFNPNMPQDNQFHYGLKIMQERAERVQGNFQLQTGPGLGTHIRVRLPREHEADTALILASINSSEEQ
jgi:two-component system, NarL family, nitrate/nitrite sensor histidine kinase NarX